MKTNASSAPTLQHELTISDPQVIESAHGAAFPEDLRVSATMAIVGPDGTTGVQWREESVDRALADLSRQRQIGLGAKGTVIVDRDHTIEGVPAIRVYGVAPGFQDLPIGDEEFMTMVSRAGRTHHKWADSQPQHETLRDVRASLA